MVSVEHCLVSVLYNLVSVYRDHTHGYRLVSLDLGLAPVLLSPVSVPKNSSRDCNRYPRLPKFDRYQSRRDWRSSNFSRDRSRRDQRYGLGLANSLGSARIGSGSTGLRVSGGLGAGAYILLNGTNTFVKKQKKLKWVLGRIL